MRTSDYKNKKEQSKGIESVKSAMPPISEPIVEPVEKQYVSPVSNPVENVWNSEPVHQESPLCNLTEEQLRVRNMSAFAYMEVDNALSEARVTGVLPVKKPVASFDLKVSRHKRWVLPVIIGSVVALIVAIVVIVFVWKPWASDVEFIETTPEVSSIATEEPIETIIEPRALLVPQVEEAIDAMFANSDKTVLVETCDQRALDTLYALLTEADSYGEDTKSTRDRVQTLELYIKAQPYLVIASNTETALVESIIEEVQRIKVATDIYTEFGLKTVTANQAQEILDDFSIYTTLKAELSGVTDYLAYDTDNVRARVSLIKHTPNRTELDLMLDSIVKEKALAEAQKAVEEAADEEARAEAEAARQRAEEELAAAQAELERLRAEQEQKTHEESTEPSTELATESSEFVIESQEQGSEAVTETSVIEDVPTTEGN